MCIIWHIACNVNLHLCSRLMALWRYINLVLLLLLLFHLEKSGIFSARKVKQIMIFLKRFGPTDQIRMSSWNGYITSPAVWGPSADRSRLEVQLHWRLCRGSWYASTWSEYALGVLNFPSKETIIDYFCHARIKFCLKLCSHNVRRVYIARNG